MQKSAAARRRYALPSVPSDTRGGPGDERQSPRKAAGARSDFAPRMLASKRGSWDDCGAGVVVCCDQRERRRLYRYRYMRSLLGLNDQVNKSSDTPPVETSFGGTSDLLSFSAVAAPGILEASSSVNTGFDGTDLGSQPQRLRRCVCVDGAGQCRHFRPNVVGHVQRQLHHFRQRDALDHRHS